ncbi:MULTISPECIES: class I SAM-dependent methyltransferase [Thermoanaerobacterium]|uniref:class I SAM-dependent methyltransferase n=1 Tax=Thermoanaerobacterium TaxID=28895 RepID=UPI00177EA5C3|nr:MULTISPECIES: class I SAM-dependent methyltransferase [Thermoanaerobacterium]MBE0067645.1 class I SAM-dependent methyltransferase [Thermoanaerobacterium thermosaccharolyticum]MBE0227228.1 class I SAM-dependent methyltransferase [Thermoanaerobacterium thermosaccharolyticum]MDE4541201.1 class I SAM-dependent methyltransferase [Thermoanaerobacterium sp. R66]
MGSSANRTEIIKRRYERIAKYYDLMESLMESSGGKKWRKMLWSEVSGNTILEAGIGTGSNILYYPEGKNIYGIDFSPKMVEIAKDKAKRYGKDVDIRVMDIENLEFNDNTFDAIVTSCVFCSVPDPIKGLKELKRVLKNDGKLFMLEHVRSKKLILGTLMDILNPLTVNTWGANINRDTVKNLKISGFKILKEENLALDIMKLIIAGK